MPHMIDSMMYAGNEPWHKLGVFVGDENITSKEAITKAGLDWKVEKRPAVFYNGNLNTYSKGDGYQVIRTDRMEALGHVGEQFTPVQNEDAFNFMDEIIGKGRAVYHTAGSLANGRRIWLLVDMKEKGEITPGDEMEHFLLLTNGHDGRTNLDILETHVRVVCANTLNMALNQKEKGLFFSFRHTKKIGEKVAQVNQALSMVSGRFSKFLCAGKLLAGEQITRKELDTFLIRLELKRANQREDISQAKKDEFVRTEKYRQLVNAFETAPGAKLAGETLWGAVNAVTYYYDHKAPSRETSSFPDKNEARLNSAWFNGGADKKTRAFELALLFASKK